MNNLLKRTISGIVFCAILIGGILCKYAFPFVFSFIIFFMMKEFYDISLGKSVLVKEKWLAIALALAGFFFFSYLWDPLKLISGAVLFVPAIIVLCCPVFSKDCREHLEKFVYIPLGMMYIAFPGSMLPILSGSMNDCSDLNCKYILLVIFLLIWATDIGAYCLGSALGQRPGAKKLAPEISPKKSWWGFTGGVLLSVGVSIALKYAGLLDCGLILSIGLGLIVACGCVTGDLLESVWKRHFGVKDSGNIIPGHGGMLDRFDSSLVAIPLASIYVTITEII